jgi:hypothetical protein
VLRSEQGNDTNCSCDLSYNRKGHKTDQIKPTTAGQAIADDEGAKHVTTPSNVDALEGDTCGERTTSGRDNEK